MFPCTQCEKKFTAQNNLNRHIRSQHQDTAFHCSRCGKAFSRMDNMKTHYNKVHVPTLPMLRSLPSSPANHSIQALTEGPLPNGDDDTDKALNAVMDRIESGAPLVTQYRRPLHGSLISYRLEFVNKMADPVTFLSKLTDTISEEIDGYLKQHTGLKLWLCLVVEYFKPTEPSESTNGYHCCKQIPITRGDRFQDKIQTGFPKILTTIEKFQSKGSGWVIKRILNVDVHFARYQPLKGCCYKPLPAAIQRKLAVVNIQNNDNKCFLWSVLAALHPVPHGHGPHFPNHYTQFENELNTTGVQFPMELIDIPQFERQNNLSINVYGWEDLVYPLYISENQGQHIDLLLYEGHYCLIRSLDRLLSDQRKWHRKKYFCHRCLYPMYTPERLAEHEPMCSVGKLTRLVEPKHPTIQFRNIQRQLRQPVIVFADFESYTTPVPSCNPDPTKSSTTKYQHHTPCSYGLLEVHQCCDEIPTFARLPTIYIGEDCSEKFVEEVVGIMMDYNARLDDPMEMDEEGFNSLDQSCSICHKPFRPEDSKARDHCHLCGKTRGMAHNDCNQMYRLKREIVIVLHNLRRYDGHLIMQQIGNVCKNMELRLDCVAKGMEDYLSFTIRSSKQSKSDSTDGEQDNDEKEAPWSIKFIDSCLFLPSSLENLVKSMPQQNFHAVKEVFGDDSTALLLRKGVFPYEYFNSPSVLDDPNLPPKEAFHNKLTGENISDEDYNHAQKVWSSFEMRTFRDYHNLYLMLDVLLLSDVFTNFRNVSLHHYSLDPAHYITLPSLAWDACLKSTEAVLHSIYDPDMYAFFEKGKRGGIAVISHRKATANNTYLPKTYDPKEPKSYIIYVDANNLYGWAMVRSLPTGDFSWLPEEESEKLDWTNIPDDSPTGYILKVDLDYPEDLQSLHNSYPLAPESLDISPEMLSPYTLDLKDDLQLGTNTTRKLAPNLMPKKNYVLHYQNLKLYLRLGLRLSKIHRVVRFAQSPWMKPYIELNTNLRAQATTNFEKDFFKLMNNSVFGKSIENVRKYIDLQLVTKDEKFIKLAANPRYKRSTIFDNDLVGMSMKKKTMCLDKPIYVGISILDMSKVLMYEYHYDYMLTTYGTKATLLFTDTDSFAYHVQTEDIYKDMHAIMNLFDTSEYPIDHPLFSTSNKKVLGKFKDETKGVPIKSFVGLRAKMYSFQCGDEEKKRAKGVKKSVVQKEICHDDYQAAIDERRKYRHKMNMFRNEKHHIYSICQAKTSLSPYDDKRYILDDGITTLAYGHHDIGLDKVLQMWDDIMDE